MPRHGGIVSGLRSTGMAARKTKVVKTQHRIARRTLLTHVVLLVILGTLVATLFAVQRWINQERSAVLDSAVPRFGLMLNVSRLGDNLSEAAGVLAVSADGRDRREALDAIAEIRATLTARMAALGDDPLEDTTRERLEGALADMARALDTLDDLVGRRLALTRTASDLNARLGLLGDQLPDLEEALLRGREPDQLGAIIDMTALDFPPGASGTRAASAIRGWARNAQVAIGMMLAASGAGRVADLDYLQARTEESLRRAAAASREGDRAAMPVMEAVQAELAAIAAGVDGEASVFRVRRQRLTMTMNTPPVLDRARQASDRLSAAVIQILADLEQDQVLRASERDRVTLVWTLGIAGLGAIGALLVLWSAISLRTTLLGRLRRLTRETLDARQGGVATLAEPRARQDEVGALALAVEGLEAERRRLAEARRTLSARLAGVMAAVPDGLLLLGSDQTIEDASPTAARLLGRNLDGVLGRPLPDLLSRADGVRAAGAIAEALHRPGTAPAPMVLCPPVAAESGAAPASVSASASTSASASASASAPAGSDRVLALTILALTVGEDMADPQIVGVLRTVDAAATPASGVPSDAS